MLQVGTDDRREQPRPDDVVALGAQVHGEDLLPSVAGTAVLPSAGDLGRQRGGGPGVHHVHFGRKTTGDAALAGRVARRDVGGGVDREVGLQRDQGGRVVRLAALVQRVPDGEGYAEETLPADQPVAVQPGHPVLVTRPHKGRVPAQLAAEVQQGLFVGQRPDPPLPARHYFQRPVAFFEKLHGMGYGARFAAQFTRRP